MESTLDSQNRRELEEFLQELVLYVDSPEEVDALLGILREIKETNIETQQLEAASTEVERMEVLLDRYDIFKVYPDRVVRIGFVRGIENASRVRPGLNSMRDSVYFLHESDTV